MPNYALISKLSEARAGDACRDDGCLAPASWRIRYMGKTVLVCDAHLRAGGDRARAGERKPDPNGRRSMERVNVTVTVTLANGNLQLNDHFETEGRSLSELLDLLNKFRQLAERIRDEQAGIPGKK